MVNLAAIDREYREIGDVAFPVIQQMLKEHGSPMLATAEATHKAAQPHSALFWAQAYMENQWEGTGVLIHPADHNPVSMRPWVAVDEHGIPVKPYRFLDPRTKDGKAPGTNGVIVSPDQSLYWRFTTDADAAAEWKYRLTDPRYKGGVYVHAHTLKEMTDIYCPPGDTHPITGVDNSDIDYTGTVTTVLHRFAAAEAALEPPSQMYTTTIPGLPGGPLETTYPIDTSKQIPAWMTYNRPGIKALFPRESVQHGNGNSNSTRAGEVNYVVGGCEGRQASYHAVGDDTGISVVMPLDEVGWHAADGAGPGNMNGYACEMIEDADLVNDEGRYTQAILIIADFMGRVAARFKTNVGPKQHWDFNYADPDRHDCPFMIRHGTVAGKPAWSSAYVPAWQAAFKDETARMSGKRPEPQPVPTPAFDWSKAAKPVAIPALSKTDVQKNDTAPGVTSSDGTDFVFVSDVVEVVKPVKRLQYASQTAKSTGPDLTTGERFIAAWLFKAKDGSYYYLTSAPYWTRVLAKDANGTVYVKRVADAPLKGTA